MVRHSRDTCSYSGKCVSVKEQHNITRIICGEPGWLGDGCVWWYFLHFMYFYIAQFCWLQFNEFSLSLFIVGVNHAQRKTKVSLLSYFLLIKQLYCNCMYFNNSWLSLAHKWPVKNYDNICNNLILPAHMELVCSWNSNVNTSFQIMRSILYS